MAFEIDISKPLLSLEPLKIKITYVLQNSVGTFLSAVTTLDFSPRNLHEPQKITYRHPGGIISYAILRPPSAAATGLVDSYSKLPVLLSLHGAGLEADSHEVRHMLDEVPDLKAWVIFPTGVTSWCGDDWREFFWLVSEGRGKWLMNDQTSGVLQM